MARMYDLLFGLPLQSGRRAAVRALHLQAGQTVLEVGVGTGITFDLYPPDVSVVGVDLSMPMLERARRRVDSGGRARCRVVQMNAERLAFDDETFDAVYAPHVISVVSDPTLVGREMVRVCRKGGRLVILNHFRSEHSVLSRLEHALSPLTRRVGFTTDLSLRQFIEETGLSAFHTEKVSLFHLTTLLACHR